MLALATDIRRQAEVDDAVARAVEAFGHLDVVANNAGYGLFGAVELEPLGIAVTLVEPGPTATAFQARLDVADTIDDYDRTVRAVPEGHRRAAARRVQLPRQVAAAVLTAVDADHPPRRLATGTTAVKEIRAALQARLDELDAWTAVAEAVDGGPAA